MKFSITITFDGETLHVTKDEPKRKVKAAAEPAMTEIAAVAPPPPPAPEIPTPKVPQASGPRFDPGFLAIVRDLPEPFTRAALAAACGLHPTDATLRLNRLKHKGWAEQPAPGLWRKTQSFGILKKDNQ